MVAIVKGFFQPTESPLYTSAVVFAAIELGGKTVRNFTKGVDPLYAGLLSFTISRVALLIKDQLATVTYFKKHTHINSALSHTLSGVGVYGGATLAVTLGFTAAMVSAQTVAAITVISFLFDRFVLPHGKELAKQCKDGWDKSAAPSAPRSLI